MPSSPTLGFTDYLKEAFNWRPRLPGLGHLPANWIAVSGFFVAGLFNPGFWFLGAALELAYLGTLSSSKRFQKLVGGKHLLAQRATFENSLERTYERLSAASQERYRSLWESCQHAVGISKVLDADMTALDDHRLSGLNQLLAIFLRLLTSRELISEAIERSDIVEIEEEITAIEGRLAEDSGETSQEPVDSPLRRSLEGNLAIQKKRLENFRKAKESLALVEAELERIENHVVLVGEEAAITGRTAALTDRLDSVTSALTETNRWLEQNADIFGGLETDPILSAAPAALPRAPAMHLVGAGDVPPPPPRPKKKSAAGH